jgi:hypothetical protein
MEDYQQQRVYSWERAVVEPYDVATMSKDEIVEFVFKACSLIGIPMPFIRFNKTMKSCRAYPGLNKIDISLWGRNAATILHEIAHLADPMAAQGLEPGHGPTFVGIAMALYERIIGVPRERLEEGIAAYRLDVRRVSLASKPPPPKDDFFAEEF